MAKITTVSKFIKAEMFVFSASVYLFLSGAPVLLEPLKPDDLAYKLVKPWLNWPSLFFWCSTYSFNKCRSFGVCTSVTGGNRARKVEGHALGKGNQPHGDETGVDAASLETQALCSGLLTVMSLSCYPRTVASQAPLSMGFPGKHTGVVCHSLFSIYIWE